LTLVLAVTNGCAVGPDYHRPKVDVPREFRFAKPAPSAASVADLPWWDVFRDEALQGLLRRALENNFDLRVAIARVGQARALARAAGDRLLPSIGVTGAAAYVNGAALPSDTYLYTGNILAAWEPDVFGGLRRGREQAHANFLASVESQHGVWLTVLGDVAQQYFQLLALDLQKEISLRTIEARQQTLDLYRTQLAGGTATGLEVSRAEADVFSAQATLSNVELQMATAENAISLLGDPPGPIPRLPSHGQLAPPPEVPSGLPSTLLDRRPDVRRAEAQLIAANAQVGVDTANLFPRFPLTAAPGLTKAALSGIPGLSIEGFAYLLLGAAVWTAPVLGGDALRAQVDASNAAKDAATVTYQQTFYTALREVADAIATLDRLREQRDLDEHQVQSLANAVDIAKTQFRGGTASYLDVVTAQESQFQAELALAQLEGQQLAAFVQLYRALGGGWYAAEARR
jgi:multidrug efflux system outer membrane protein